MRTIRAAAHVHSEWSYDAHWTLAELAAAFAKRGYDTILMAEHDRTFDESRWQEYRSACADASNDRITVVPGIEYEDAESVTHVPVWGADAFLGAGRPTLELLRAARDAGGFPVLAHLARRNAFARYAHEWAPLLGAVEVWNRHYDGVAPNLQAWELAEREGVQPFAALDFHTRRQFFPLGLLVEVEGPTTPRSIADALDAGRFELRLQRLPLTRFRRGAPARAVQAGERLRRGARGPVRRLQRRLGRPE